MRENEIDVIGNYEIDVRATRKIRDGVWYDTNKGPVVLKEMKMSDYRIQALQILYEVLKERGADNVDWIVKNKSGEAVTVLEDGTKYYLKHWFMGRECDIHKESDVLSAVRNMGFLHEVLKDPFADEKDMDLSFLQMEDMEGEFVRHNRELRKVRAFMRKRVSKGAFEFAFLKEFDAMYEWAQCALKSLEESSYRILLEKAKETQSFVHGDYNYHNLFMQDKHIATTGFEHFKRDIPVQDFYYFLRKVMEKQHWNVKLGNQMMETYQKAHSLGKQEMEYLAICIAYPEKFWKVANSYYRSNKVWVSSKNVEKLELVIKQTEEKKEFLQSIFSFHL